VTAKRLIFYLTEGCWTAAVATPLGQPDQMEMLRNGIG
jgi:hypothetical protein